MSELLLYARVSSNTRNKLKQCKNKSIRKNRVKFTIGEITNHRCCYCGVVMNYDSLTDSNSFTYEHIIPKRYGGKWCRSNLIGSCYKCNGDRSGVNLDYLKIHVDELLDAGICLSTLSDIVESNYQLKDFV